MKNLFICLILVSFFFGCGESSEQENGDADSWPVKVFNMVQPRYRHHSSISRAQQFMRRFRPVPGRVAKEETKENKRNQAKNSQPGFYHEQDDADHQG